jgi:hypothetical protein
MNTKLQTPLRSTIKCKIHKYRRFSKRNKTFRTDIYYCANCSSHIPLNMLYGKLIECWRCGRAFNFLGNKNNTLPLKPECGCKNEDVINTSSSINDNPNTWMEERKELTRDEVLEDLLGMIEEENR